MLLQYILLVMVKIPLGNILKVTSFSQVEKKSPCCYFCGATVCTHAPSHCTVCTCTLRIAAGTLCLSTRKHWKPMTLLMLGNKISVNLCCVPSIQVHLMATLAGFPRYVRDLRSDFTSGIAQWDSMAEKGFDARSPESHTLSTMLHWSSHWWWMNLR